VRVTSWLGAATLAVLLGASPAFAADARLPSLGSEPDARFKAERYLARLEKDGVDVAAWRTRLKSGEPARDVIHKVLLERSPEYKAAVEKFERDGTNAEDFLPIVAKASDPALKAHALYFEGRAYLARDEFEKAAAAFSDVRGALHLDTPWADEATLYLGYSYARTPELDEQAEIAERTRARHCLETIVGAEDHKATYRDAPERVRESAGWLLRELRGEGLGPLLELAKRMETIERLIDRERTDTPVQRKQEEVVVVLDKLIELLREKEDGG
jgi:hypothetical protein